MKIENPTFEELKLRGEVIKSIMDGCVRLYAYGDKPPYKEYVVLCDNSVISREEDNDGSDEAFFPYKDWEK